MGIVQLSESQSVSMGVILVAIYLVATPISTKEIHKLTLTCIIAQAYCLSPLYNATLEYNSSLVFLVYASIYFTAIRYLQTYKVIAACFIMALFEGLMYKAYLNELGHKGFEEWLYFNYESIVTLLHVVAIGSVVSGSKLRSITRFLSDNVLRPFLCNRLLLPFRG